MPLKAAIALVVTGLGLALSGGVRAQSSGADVATARDLRDVRYCELIVAKRKGVGIEATVYNTLGLNDCPDELWSALSEEALKARFDALTVVLNGPRHWVLDGIVGSGATAAGETIDVDGLGFTERATLEPGLLELRSRPYEERRIDRATQWLYSAGQPMFVLAGPDGSRYAMQSYAQIRDPTLSYDDLPDLASRLSLPAGWSFAVYVPGTDQTYPSGGQATVVQDEFDNTYQKLP